MKMLLTSLTVLMALLCAVTMRSAGAKNNAKVTRESKLEAEQLWELAIAAKGGRERLYAVRNLLVSSGYRYKSKSQRREVKTRFEDFYVFPDKAWRWSDERPAIWGVKVEMINHERGFEYITYPNDPTSPRRLKIGLPEDNPNIDAQLFYLMETRWQRPQPISAESGKLNGKPVDIVHTAVNERKVDFVLDRQTHLLMEVVDYSPTGIRYSDTDTD